ncbi:MAG: hypothetical protein AAF639_46790 [Chloroflexota bacterium]
MTANTSIQQPTQRKIKWSVVGHYALLIILALIIIFPGYMMILTSLKRQVMIMSKEPLWFFSPTLSNYEKILEQENFIRHLVSSVYVGLASTLLTLFVSSWAAYAISRMKF